MGKRCLLLSYQSVINKTLNNHLWYYIIKYLFTPYTGDIVIPRPLFLLYKWLSAFKQIAFSWHAPNPDLSLCQIGNHDLSLQKTLLQGPMVVYFEPSPLMLRITLSNLKLVCGCSALETQLMEPVLHLHLYFLSGSVCVCGGCIWEGNVIVLKTSMF